MEQLSFEQARGIIIKTMEDLEIYPPLIKKASESTSLMELIEVLSPLKYSSLLNDESVEHFILDCLIA